MYEQMKKPKENKSRAVANSVAQKKSNGIEAFGFVDNRLGTIQHVQWQTRPEREMGLSGRPQPQIQRMMNEDEGTDETQVTLPQYFYHATPKKNARAIAQNGLQARSVGGQEGAYLCMSGVESGATTLGRAASDIVFRVASSNLDPQSWTKSGAGKEEWRSTADVPGASLEYRRYLGNAEQKTWRPTSDTLYLL